MNQILPDRPKYLEHIYIEAGTQTDKGHYEEPVERMNKVGEPATAKSPHSAPIQLQVCTL